MEQSCCCNHHQIPPLCHCIRSPTWGFAKHNTFLTDTLFKYRAGRCNITNLSYQIQSSEGAAQLGKGSLKGLGCLEGIPYYYAWGIHKDYRSEHVIWSGSGSGKHILGWREIASPLKRERHLKVLNCKDKNFTQSLNFGVPITYNTTLTPCSCCSSS